jgi:hypothetical protein
MIWKWRLSLFVPIALLLAAVHVSAFDTDYEALIERAEEAIDSGNVQPDRDLKPLVEALQQAKTDEDRRRLIDKISWMGRSDGDSPPEVKRYLLQQATPVLLKIGKIGGSAFTRGDALMALRDMGASRSVLEQAAAIAEQDPDDFVRSRGEILRNYIKTMPAGSSEK